MAHDAVNRSPRLTIHVTPTGHDFADGSAAHPLRTLHAARNDVRARLASGHDSAATPGPPPAIDILLGDGVFELGETLVLDDRDSGRPGAPVRWAAAPGAAPVLAGGRRLQPDWQPGHGDGRVVFADIGPGLAFDQLFADGQRQILARYPNVVPGERLDGFAADAIAPARVRTWSDPTTAQVRAMHLNDWGGTSYTVSGVLPSGDLDLRWVGDNQRGSEPHALYRMVENVLEELDSPGEWFYDRGTGRLSYWPATDVDLATAAFETAELDELIRIDGGSSDRPAHDIELSGLAFTRTSRTLFTGTYEPISLSDWSIVRKAAVRLRNTERIRVEGSTFTDLGGNALFVDGYGRDDVIDDNEFAGSGASDVIVLGLERAARQASTWGAEQSRMTDVTPGPLTEDYPRDITVSSNLMTRMGRFEKQSAGVQISRAARITVAHNTIHDGPRAAINIGDGTWGGHRIIANDIWDMVGETGDHGPVNTWGRDRFWPIDDATDAQRKAWSTLDHLEPTIIEGNRIRHDSGWAVDLDDGSSNYVVRHNLFLDAGTKFREGFNRSVVGNVYVNGGAHFHVSYADTGDLVEANVFLTSTPYHFIRADPAHSGIRHERNLFWNDGGPVGTVDDTWRANGLDVDSLIADPRFIGPSPWADPSKIDYVLAADSPANSLGFVDLDMRNVGRPGTSAGPIRLSWPAAAAATGPGTSAPVSEAVDWLGAACVVLDSDTLASSVGLIVGAGVYILDVASGSPAHTAGIRTGDVVRRIDDNRVTEPDELLTRWLSAAAGSEVAVTVWRNQGAVEVRIHR